MTNTGRAVVGLATSLLIAGCMSDEVELTTEADEIPSWEAFRASVYQEPWADGVFILDGDVPVADEAALLDVYEAAYLGDGALIVNRRGNADDRWSGSAQQNITYCVSRTSFGSRYNTVVSAMNSATGAWEGAADVNFVHNSSLDGNCNAQSGVVFDVRQVSGQGYLARAFFPSSSRSQRNVLIDSSSFGNISPWTLTGILRHELGHTLGFRHEHTRPEARTCFEDNSWRALTPYDSASVMHYPQCNGSRTGDLVLTTRDRQGAAALYGAP